MSYASRVGFSNEAAIDSETLSERPGVGVAVRLTEGLGKGGGFAFWTGLTTAGGGVATVTFSFSNGSVISLGKRGTFGSLGWEVATPVMSLPFTRRSRLPELAT